jgi:poly-gamma-glutamate synthesis protein (capsule biosynthesis protein)
MTIVVVSALSAWLLWPKSVRPTIHAVRQAPATSTVQVQPEGLTSRLLFVGDVMWGRSIQTHAKSSGLDYQYPTSGLTRTDRNAYDAWIANFECPVTTKDVPYSLQVDILKFNCRPEYLANLATWFTAVSQANNHTMNVDGQWGIEQGRQNFERAGIQYFGNYDMSKLDDICEVITVPATTTKTHKQVSLPVALCGYMYVVDVAPTDAQLAVMQKYAKVMPVIAMPHMGVEFRSTAETEKESAYRRMIDNGADAVIGAHPHVIQNSETYKGRLIAYSLGNFLFDQQSLGRETTLGLGVGIKLGISDDKAARIYEQLAPTCKAFRDDCVAKLSSRLSIRPTITVSYTFTCYDESRAVGSVPHLGSKQVCDQARQAATVDRLNGLSKQW